MQQKIIFIDRDGTLIKEPDDKQIDALEKFELLPQVIQSLQSLAKANFRFVMVSNQDGLGTAAFPQENFYPLQNLLISLLGSQGIQFDAIRICPHLPTDACTCRKPAVGLVLDYLQQQRIDREHSFVIGDRETDMILAKNLGIKGLLLGGIDAPDWKSIVNTILKRARTAQVHRKTQETDIEVQVNLDQPGEISIVSGIPFFDHLLTQLAKHGGFSLQLSMIGDLQVDDHHSIEDVGLVLGEVLRQALHDKYGIERYGFLLPMDEALVEIALDLSGRPYLNFDAQFTRESVGTLATEMISHFFRSFTDNLRANLHIKVRGQNHHHMIEAIFKGVGKTLQQAIRKTGEQLPSTKGVL